MGTFVTSCSGAVAPNYQVVYKPGAHKVLFDWHGFFQPIDSNLDTTVATIDSSTKWNSAKAGSTVPVKFDLGGDQGLGIFKDGKLPTMLKVTCPNSSTTVDAIEEYSTATTSGLKYDATVNAPVGQYNFAWKTDAALAGTCQRLNVALLDGTVRYAFFKFTK